MSRLRSSTSCIRAWTCCSRRRPGHGQLITDQALKHRCDSRGLGAEKLNVGLLNSWNGMQHEAVSLRGQMYPSSAAVNGVDFSLHQLLGFELAHHLGGHLDIDTSLAGKLKLVGGMSLFI
jgi:hypothetical protein